MRPRCRVLALGLALLLAAVSCADPVEPERTSETTAASESTESGPNVTEAPAADEGDAIDVADPPIVFASDASWVSEVVVLGDGRVAWQLGGGLVQVWDPAQPSSDPALGPGDGRGLLLADGVVVAPDGEEGWVLHRLEEPTESPIAVTDELDDAVSFESLAGGVLVAWDFERRLRFWDPARPAVSPIAVDIGDAFTGRLQDGRLAIQHQSGDLELLDPTRPGEPVRLRGHENVVREVLVLSDGRVVSTADGGVVLLWDPAQVEGSPARYDGHTATVWSLAELADGRVASASDDGTVQVWHPDEPTASATVLVSGGFLTEVLVLGDGRIASAGSDATIRIWDLAAPDADPIVLRGHTEWVVELRQMPDGRLVSAAEDGSVRIWDLGRP